MAKQIELSRGKIAVVDDADYLELKNKHWFFNSGYAATYLGHGRKNRKQITMHRFIIFGDSDSELEIDHRDGNRLNNCRSNLRIATRSQNGANRGITRNNSTGYKGVTYEKQRCLVKKWRAVIKGITIGRFGTAEEAAHAYDSRANELFGEFAKTNFSGKE